MDEINISLTLDEARFIWQHLDGGYREGLNIRTKVIGAVRVAGKKDEFISNAGRAFVPIDQDHTGGFTPRKSP